MTNQRRRKLGRARSHALAVELFQCVTEAVESLEEDDLGADLAWLLGAILTDTSCSWESNRPLVVLLRTHFPEDSPLWRFLQLEPAIPAALGFDEVLSPKGPTGGLISCNKHVQPTTYG